MSRLLLVRHGATELNATMRFQGHIDIELSEAGHMQMEKLRDRLAAEKIEVIYYSDLRRAVTSAQIISSVHEASIVACPELKEISYGAVEGMDFGDISRLYPEVAESCISWSTQLKFPGGESFEEFARRVSQFPERLKKHKEQTILIVAHGGPLRVLLCQFLGLELWRWRQFQISVASLTIVETGPDTAIINLLNDTSHLGKRV